MYVEERQVISFIFLLFLYPGAEDVFSLCSLRRKSRHCRESERGIDEETSGKTVVHDLFTLEDVRLKQRSWSLGDFRYDLYRKLNYETCETPIEERQHFTTIDQLNLIKRKVIEEFPLEQITDPILYCRRKAYR